MYATQHTARPSNRLMSHPTEANEVMESVQRVTTGAGLRARSDTDLSPRGWRSMARKDNVGRFVPDNECTKEQSQVIVNSVLGSASCMTGINLAGESPHFSATVFGTRG